MQKGFRKDIQFFRGFAVISVVLCHLFPFEFENLKIGVDIFFVISGFVITKSILNSSKFGLNEFKNFISKRIKRIFPLSLISSLSIWITFQVLAPGTFSQIDAFASIFGFQNILLGFRGRPYGGIGPNLNPYTPFWSLGVEEQYYFIYPLILLILFSIVVKNNNLFIKKTKKLYEIKSFMNKFLKLLIVIGSFSFITYTFNYDPANAWSYFNPIYRFWEIILGCIAYIFHAKKYVFQKEENLNQKLIKLISISIFIISFIFFAIYGNTQLHIFILVLTLLSFSFYIANPINKVSILFLRKLCYFFKPIQFIGDISFSIYIWHWPILLYFKLLEGGSISPRNIFSYLFVLSIISIISNKIIEGYISNNLFTNKLPNEFLIYIFSIFSFSLAILGDKISEKIGYKFRPYKLETTPSTFVSNEVKSTGELNCTWGYENSFTNEDDYSNLIKCLDSQKSYKSKKNIFLIGDSHSTAFAPAVYRYAIANNLNLIRATHVYCPFRMNFSMNWQVTSPVKDFSCSNFNNGVYEYLSKNSNKGDYVILASRDLFYYSDEIPISREHKTDYEKGFIKYFDNNKNYINTKKVMNQSIKNIRNLANELSSKKIPIIIVLQGHENKNPLHYCDNIFSKNIKSCKTNYEEVKMKRVYAQKIKSIAANQNNLFIFDLLPITCPDKKYCTHLINDKYIFRDDDHLSNYASKEFIYQDFRNIIKDIQ